jgi:2',3'-cyclic-nucleotide 2'-phosphodiesterase (5'-nucleotidase family)
MIFKTISLTAVYATVAFAVIGTSQQPSSQIPSVPYLVRNLTWGQLNFIHTTDTHGWLPGHLLEPNFSADWGDLISFTQHARRLADEAGVDILVVDSGDRHDGNGLSDATTPKAELTERLFTKIDYDVVSIGNHELYKWESTVQEYEIIAPAFGERYVVSNVDLLWNGKWTSIGNKYRRFETKNQKLKVVAFGFLFDFRGNNPRTRVTRCADAVKEDWFLEALSYDDTEVFVIASHIPVRVFPEMNIIISAIRRAHPLAIIQFLGGHSHVRDFAVVDDRSTALESGRFLETIGWLSIDNINTNSLTPIPKFSRSYIDFNVRSLSIHSNTSLEKDEKDTVFFHTPEGQTVSREIAKLRSDLELDTPYGCVPRSFLTSRAEYPGPDNLFSLLVEKILPNLVGTWVPIERSLNHPRYIVINTGSIRFDLFKGPYTLDTSYIISPFPNNWKYFPDVPLKFARKLLPELNKLPYIFASAEDDESDQAGRQSVYEANILRAPEQRYLSYNFIQASSPQQPAVVNNLQYGKHLKPGYVTYDDYGNDGDDTLHKPWPFVILPNAVQAEQNIPESATDDTKIDIVIYDFLLPFVLRAFAKIGYPVDEYHSYGGLNTVELLTNYVNQTWPAEKLCKWNDDESNFGAKHFLKIQGR